MIKKLLKLGFFLFSLHFVSGKQSPSEKCMLFTQNGFSEEYKLSHLNLEHRKEGYTEKRLVEEMDLMTELRLVFSPQSLEGRMDIAVEGTSGANTIEVVHKTENLEITRLDDNLFVHKSFLKQYNNHPCNGMIYINNGEAVVFDTPTDDSTSVELIKWIENDLQADIKAIVINHFHIDCLGGLAGFHNVGIPSYASSKTITFAKSEKAHNDIVPQISFTDSLKIEVGDTYVENKYFGAGHSLDNIVSYIKDKKALFGGCLIKAEGATKGSLTDADTAAWSHTVQKVKDYYSDDFRFVVPGHGKPGGIELLDFTIDLFENK